MLHPGRGDIRPPTLRRVEIDPALHGQCSERKVRAGRGPRRLPIPPLASQSTPWALALGSVGVVYGDIGTSPLYAFREAVQRRAGPVTREIVLGVLSLILWALIVVVTLKYVLLLLRADNNGEGGTLSLTALATRALGRRTTLVFLLGLIGAAMFLGDVDDHAGDLGAVGGRGPEARDAGASSTMWCRSRSRS